MDIGTIFRISGSALGAQKQRLQAVAENLAGANVTQTADGTPYRRKDVVFSSFKDQLSQAQAGQGAQLVKATTTEDNRPFNIIYKPGHPHADENGYLKTPNVNVMEEMANMISASRSYEANVKVLGATRQMAAKALEIGQ